MDGSVQRRDGRPDAGGITGLAAFVLEHREAVEYDLLTRTGYQLSDVGGRLDWAALKSFVAHSPVDGALLRELHPDIAAWATTAKTNAILADIYDLVALAFAYMRTPAGQSVKRPKPYPRPVKQNNENVHHFGKDGLPPDELRKWFERKRQEHASSSKRDNTGDART